jgi:hypothetical protein
MLSDEAREEFKKLYLEEFGEEISDAKATDLAINLLTLFDHIYRPVKKSWLTEQELKEIEEENQRLKNDKK